MEFLSRLQYCTTTKFSGKIEVFESVGVRRLVVGNLIQSVSRNYPGLANKVWGKLVDLPFSLAEKPAVLILGLGGGTTVHLVSRKFKPAKITAVEIDPAIVVIAQKYFEIGRVKNLKVVCQDAFEFLKEEKERFYDLILVDIYQGSVFPALGLRKDFYQLVNDKLRANGVTAINRIFQDGRQKEKASFKRLLESVWSELLEKKIEAPSINKNYLFYARKSGG